MSSRAELAVLEHHHYEGTFSGEDVALETSLCDDDDVRSYFLLFLLLLLLFVSFEPNATLRVYDFAGAVVCPVLLLITNYHQYDLYNKCAIFLII